MNYYTTSGGGISEGENGVVVTVKRFDKKEKKKFIKSQKPLFADQ